VKDDTSGTTIVVWSSVAQLSDELVMNSRLDIDELTLRFSNLGKFLISVKFGREQVKKNGGRKKVKVKNVL